MKKLIYDIDTIYKNMKLLQEDLEASRRRMEERDEDGKKCFAGALGRLDASVEWFLNHSMPLEMEDE